MVSVTHSYRQRLLVSNVQRRMPPATTRAVEIQVPIENPNADRALCRILILPPSATTTEPHLIHVRAACNTPGDGSADTAGGRFHLGPFADEEPTWEDAEWQ